MNLFFFALAALFSVMNPLGTIPIFVGLTQEHSPRERSRISLITVFNVLLILLISFYGGKYLLQFFGISIESLRIAGGLIIISSGFALLTGTFSRHKGMEKPKVKEDLNQREQISLTPLAIPMLAGPGTGTISLLIGYYESYSRMAEQLVIVGAIITVCLVSFLMLKSAHYIAGFLGASGLNAISRIIGFIVIAIGIEYVSAGVLTYLKL